LRHPSSHSVEQLIFALHVIDWGAAQKAVACHDTHGLLIFAEQLLTVIGVAYPPAMRAEQAIEVIALIHEFTTQFGKSANVEQLEIIHPLPDGH
jgi:hypothetical protein